MVETRKEKSKLRDYLEKFDELYVISDLHMGGKGGFQILRETKRLAGLVRWIKNKRPLGRVGLVLNGDVIDTLAEPDLSSGEYAFLDADRAEDMLQRLYTDPSFVDIWAALSEFVSTKARQLIIVIGNHDIEMALPFVQASITKRLMNGDLSARSRILFTTHGAGFSCYVGPARVFCTHGNEMDDWNIVDYNKLGQVANALNAGRRVNVAKWEPNAGTQLAVDAMNDIKRRYPFVDLLKPETNPLFGVLLTLAPEMVLKRLGHLAPIIEDKLKGASERRRTLEADPEPAQDDELGNDAEPDIESLLGSNLRNALANAKLTDKTPEDELLASLEKDIDNNVRASDAAEQAAIDGELGFWDTVKGWSGLFSRRLRGVSKEESLRQSLQDWLAGDETFSPETRDDTFRRIIERAGPDVQFVLTGHTHLARAIEVEEGERYYLNTGTWIRLIRFTEQLLNSPKAFASVFSTLGDEKRKMKALDGERIPGPNGTDLPLVLDRTNVARIAVGEDGVIGELLRVVGDAGTDEQVERQQELKDWSQGSPVNLAKADLTPRFLWRP